MNTSSTNYQNLPTIDAVASIANTHLGTTGAKFDQIDPNAQVGAIENAIETGAGKLGQVNDIRQAINVAQSSSNDASFTNSSAAQPQSGVTGQILRAGAYLGLGFVAPPVAAAMAVVEGVKWAASPVNNGVHEHAALVSGQSSFKSYSSSAKKGDDPAVQYTDTSGDSYTNGLKTAAPAVQPQQRPGAAPNPYMGAAAKALEGRDPNQLDKELGGVVTAEKKLLDQVAAGQEAARDKFGVDSPALQVQKPVFSTGPRPGFFG